MLNDTFNGNSVWNKILPKYDTLHRTDEFNLMSVYISLHNHLKLIMSVFFLTLGLRILLNYVFELQGCQKVSE